MNRHHSWNFAILLLLCAVAVQLPAATITVSSTPNLDGSNAIPLVITEATGDVGTDDSGKIKTWVGEYNTLNFNVSWDLEYNADPSVSGTIAVVNNQPVTQFFAIETGVFSTVAVPAGGILQGSSSITVADADGSGTNAIMMAPPGDAVYSGKIQGITQKPLFGAPYGLSSNPNVSNTDIRFFPNPGPDLSTTALPVGGLVSLRHAFTLTSGDSATANSTFIVNIPSPAGSVLLWLGLLGLSVCRRSRTQK